MYMCIYIYTMHMLHAYYVEFHVEIHLHTYSVLHVHAFYTYV